MRNRPEEIVDEVDTALLMTKRRISLAALACIRGAPDHAAQVARALEAVEVARHALQNLLRLSEQAEDAGEGA